MASPQIGPWPLWLTCALLTLTLAAGARVGQRQQRGSALETSQTGLSSFPALPGSRSASGAPGAVPEAVKPRGETSDLLWRTEAGRRGVRKQDPSFRRVLFERFSRPRVHASGARVDPVPVLVPALACSPGLPLVCQNPPLRPNSTHGRVQQFQSELQGSARGSLRAAGGAPEEHQGTPLQGTSELLKSSGTDATTDGTHTTNSTDSTHNRTVSTDGPSSTHSTDSPDSTESADRHFGVAPGRESAEEDFFQGGGGVAEGQGKGADAVADGTGEGRPRPSAQKEEERQDGAEKGDKGQEGADAGGNEVESPDVEAEASRMGNGATDPAVVAKARELLAAWGTWPWLQLEEPSASAEANASIPSPPHMEDCDTLTRLRRQLDERSGDGSRPLWSFYGGTSGLALGLNQGPEAEAARSLVGEGEKGEALLRRQAQPSVVGPLPPWVAGADEDNLILTRRVQRDLWVHQHPRDCGAPGVRFLVANMTHGKHAFLGVGAQLGAMAGLLSKALKLDRVLVLDYYDKADHPGCPGPLRGSFRCYFAPETSAACRKRALGLLQQGQGVLQGSGTGAQGTREAEAVALINALPYRFTDASPGLWGTPWAHLHPSVAVQGVRVRRTEDDSHRWFRAQALRYLLRFPSRRLCALANRARHAAFGAGAALELALALALKPQDSQGVAARAGRALEPLWHRAPGAVYQGRGALVSMHVRQGDKGQEMVVHPFKDHMALAHAIRLRFPNAQSIWLSTEVQVPLRILADVLSDVNKQDVVDESLTYKGWRFYYTKVARQVKAHEKMAEYEGALGLQKSTDNAFVNLMIATGCDFFVGTMGSTWSVVIDDLRRTSGKEPRGMLSVNKDRYWMSSRERKEKNLIFR